MVQSIASVLAIVAYLTAAVFLLRALLDTVEGRDRSLRALALITALLALCLQTAALWPSLFRGGALTLGFSSSLSLFAWQCVALLLLLSAFRPLVSLGVVIYPAAAVCAAAAWLMPTDVDAVRGLAGPIEIHIILSMLAYGLITIAAVQAVVVALQDHALRHHRPYALLRTLPPLQTMESLLFELIAGGWFLLTLALASGLFFVDNLFAEHLAHKTILSTLAWLVFTVLLWARLRFGWRGRAAVRWTLGGYVFLILAYFGSKMVLELILSTHWH